MLCNHYPNSKIFSTLEKKPIHSEQLLTIHSLFPQPLTTTYLLLSLQISLFGTLHINKIRQDTTFYDWLISLSIMFQFHLFSNVSVLQSFYGCFVCDKIFLFTHLLVVNLGCFHLLTIVNNIPYPLVYKYPFKSPFLILLDIYRGIELLSHIILYLTFEHLPNCSPQQLNHYTFSSLMFKDSNFSTSLPTLISHYFFHYCYYSISEVVAQGFDLHLPNG